MRVCTECKFHKHELDRHACTAIIDLVTGEQKDVECYEARAASWLCGTDGNLFKQRGEAESKDQLGRPAPLDISRDNRRDLKRGRSDG